MKKLLLVALLTATPAMAEEQDNGFYIGVGVGSAEVVDAKDLDIDDNQKIFWGYKLNEFFSVDQAYGNFGTTKETYYYYAVELSGLTTQLVARYDNETPFTPYVKLGLASWKVKSGDFTDSGNDVVYGVGLGFDIGKVTFKTEVETMNLDGEEFRQIMGTIQYNF